MRARQAKHPVKLRLHRPGNPAICVSSPRITSAGIACDSPGRICTIQPRLGQPQMCRLPDPRRRARHRAHSAPRPSPAATRPCRSRPPFNGPASASMVSNSSSTGWNSAGVSRPMPWSSSTRSSTAPEAAIRHNRRCEVPQSTAIQAGPHSRSPSMTQIVSGKAPRQGQPVVHQILPAHHHRPVLQRNLATRQPTASARFAKVTRYIARRFKPRQPQRPRQDLGRTRRLPRKDHEPRPIRGQLLFRDHRRDRPTSSRRISARGHPVPVGLPPGGHPARTAASSSVNSRGSISKPMWRWAATQARKPHRQHPPRGVADAAGRHGCR